MKPTSSNQGNRAMTLFELLVVLATILFLAVIFLDVILPDGHGRARRKPTCINNLKEIGLAYRVWAGDNNDKYPMGVSVANGGAMELAATGNVLSVFLVMSNELSTPKILYCPEDPRDQAHLGASQFGPSFTATNISYFIGLDADESLPLSILSGDDNFATTNVAAGSGLLNIPTNVPIAWTTGRHLNAGNIGFGDGSVLQLATNNLQMAFQQTGLATNRFIIP